MSLYSSSHNLLGARHHFPIASYPSQPATYTNDPARTHACGLLVGRGRSNLCAADASSPNWQSDLALRGWGIVSQAAVSTSED